jgi:hypothetical protein
MMRWAQRGFRPAVILFVLSSCAAPWQQSAATPAPTFSAPYRADEVILPPEQFPLSGYRVAKDQLAPPAGWIRSFAPANESAASPRIDVVVRVIGAAEASDPAAYLKGNAMCGGLAHVMNSTAPGVMLTCEVQEAHDAAGRPTQHAVLSVTDPNGFGAFAERILVGRYLVLVSTGLGDASGDNENKMSNAMLLVTQAQVGIIAKLTH